MEELIEEEWSKTFDTIKSKHDLAYKTIEKAIRNEEQEQPEMAIINYKLGISLIDEGLNVQVAVPDDPIDLDESWSDACRMIQVIFLVVFLHLTCHLNNYLKTSHTENEKDQR